MKIFKKNIFTLIGVILGGIIGFIYWNQIGCANGQCMIKSNPYLMISYGVFIGGILGSIVNDKVYKKKNSSHS